jgi:hypothetical protein
LISSSVIPEVVFGVEIVVNQTQFGAAALKFVRGPRMVGAQRSLSPRSLSFLGLMNLGHRCGVIFRIPSIPPDSGFS